MKKVLNRSLVLLLAFLMFLGPGMVQVAIAQDDDDTASPDEVKVIQKLAKQGYLADKKDFYLSAKALTDDDITDALVAIDDQLSKVVLKDLKPGDKTYHLEDLQALLPLVKDKAEDIRARKVSAWKFEKRVEKMIAYLTPPASPDTAATADPTPSTSATVKEASQIAAEPRPTSTATPIPGPNREEWNEMKDDIKDLIKKAGDLQDVYDKKIDAMQKTNDDIKTNNADNREQLRLVKKILDQVQTDLNKTNAQLDEVAMKADKKNITDTELTQQLQVMRKDLRDNSQDVSILKQEVAKLSQSQEKPGQSVLDDVLGSKWVAGGALVVGLTALVVSLTRK